MDSRVGADQWGEDLARVRALASIVSVVESTGTFGAERWSNGLGISGGSLWLRVEGRGECGGRRSNVRGDADWRSAGRGGDRRCGWGHLEWGADGRC